MLGQKWRTVLRTQPHLLGNSTDTAKERFFPTSPRDRISRMPRFRQHARASRCHNTAIGLYSTGV
jgi:hypothetical protein